MNTGASQLYGWLTLTAVGIGSWLYVRRNFQKEKADVLARKEQQKQELQSQSQSQKDHKDHTSPSSSSSPHNEVDAFVPASRAPQKGR